MTQPGTAPAEIVRREPLNAPLWVYPRTTCQTVFSVRPSPQDFPFLFTRGNILPVVRLAARSHSSTIALTQAGIGIVLVWPAFPFMSTMAVVFPLLDVAVQIFRLVPSKAASQQDCWL
jgi:hypothetical protein